MKKIQQIGELQLLQVISVAQAFDNFEVNYDPVDKKTIIRGWARYCTNNFFWTSDDTIKEFYQELERFFMEEGKKSVVHHQNWDVVPKTRSLEYGDIEL